MDQRALRSNAGEKAWKKFLAISPFWGTVLSKVGSTLSKARLRTGSDSTSMAESKRHLVTTASATGYYSVTPHYCPVTTAFRLCYCPVTFSSTGVVVTFSSTGVVVNFSPIDVITFSSYI